MYLFESRAIWALIPVASIIAVFTFLSVASWAQQRRRERESYYSFEFRKNLVEAGKMDASDVRELIHYEQQTQMYKSRQSSIVGGFVLLGVGAGMLLGLRWITEADLWMVGFIPLCIGVALTIYALFVAPRDVPGPPRSFGRPPSDG